MQTARNTRRRQRRRCEPSLKRWKSFSTANLIQSTPSPQFRHVDSTYQNSYLAKLEVFGGRNGSAISGGSTSPTSGWSAGGSTSTRPPPSPPPPSATPPPPPPPTPQLSLSPGCAPPTRMTGCGHLVDLGIVQSLLGGDVILQ